MSERQWSMFWYLVILLGTTVFVGGMFYLIIRFVGAWPW